MSATKKFLAAAALLAAGATGQSLFTATTPQEAREEIAAAHDVTTRHGELAVRVDAGGADVTALAAVDPGTTGQVFTVGDAGIPVWRAAAAGGPVAGSGTYASRPASPALGDTYTVTSGARTGSVYRCDVAGAWVLSRVLPLISTATAAELLAFDAESILDVVGQSLAAWPEARGRVTLTQANVAAPTAQITATAASWGGLPFAQFPASGTSVVLGAPATAGPSGAAARTFAVLVSSVPNWTTAGSAAQNVGGWGSAGSNSAWTIRANASAANVTGMSFYGTDPTGSGAYPSSSTPTVLYAVYTGTQYALYQTPVDAASESTSVALTTLAVTTTAGALPGGISAVFGFVLGAHSYSRNVEFFRGRLHGAWVYDRALDATAREALRAALATRYGS